MAVELQLRLAAVSGLGCWSGLGSMWPLPSALAVESRSGLAAVSGLSCWSELACWSELGPMWPLPLVLAKALAVELLPRPVAESLSFQEPGWKLGALPAWA